MNAVVRIPIGHSANNAATRNISTSFACYSHGWDSAEWLQFCLQYKRLGFNILWPHNPHGADVPMSFDQQRRAAAVLGLEKIADRAAYRRMIYKLSQHGMKVISYIGSPHMMSEKPEQIEEWWYGQVDHLLVGDARICFDAASWNDTNRVTYDFLMGLEYADKGSSPCIVESISERGSDCWRWDQCALYPTLVNRCIDRPDGRWPKLWDDEFPKVRIYVIWQSSATPLSEIRENLAYLREKGPGIKFIPCVHWYAIDKAVKAGECVEIN